MSDETDIGTAEQTQATGAVDTQTAGGEQQREKLYTQEQVNKIVQARLERERQSQERRVEQPKQQDPKPKPPADGNDVVEQLAAMQRTIEEQGIMIDSTARGFSDAEKQTALELLRQGVKDPLGVIESIKGKKAQTSEPAKQVTETAQQPVASPVQDAGVPTDRRDFSQLIHPKTLSRDDVQRLLEMPASDGKRSKLLEVMDKWIDATSGSGGFGSKFR